MECLEDVKRGPAPPKEKEGRRSLSYSDAYTGLSRDYILGFMMKFLLHSWLRPDGICAIYVYYVTSNILDSSGNAPLSLAGVPAFSGSGWLSNLIVTIRLIFSSFTCILL